MTFFSPFANLHDAIIARITDQVPEIPYIEQDLGQLEDYDTEPIISWPCALLDVGNDFNYTVQGGKNDQLAEGMVIIRLGLVKYTDSNNQIPNNIRESSFQYYEIEEKLVKALHGWKPQGFSKLLRHKITTEKTDDGIRVRVISFTTSFTDNAAMPVYTTVARPNLELGKDFNISS